MSRLVQEAFLMIFLSAVALIGVVVWVVVVAILEIRKYWKTTYRQRASAPSSYGGCPHSGCETRVPHAHDDDDDDSGGNKSE